MKPPTFATLFVAFVFPTALNLATAGDLIAFPQDRVRAATGDHSATPLCRKLLTNETMAQAGAHELARTLAILFHSHSRSYVHEVNKLIAQLSEVTPADLIWQELWIPVLFNEVTKGRLQEQHGFSQRQILRAETLVLKAIAHDPDYDFFHEFLKDTTADFFRWEDTRRGNPRANLHWRAAWMEAEISVFHALRESDDRFAILTWINSEVSGDDFPDERKRVTRIASYSPNRTTRSRAKLWLRDIDTLLEQRARLDADLQAIREE